MALAHKTIISGLSFDRSGNAVLTLGLIIADGAIEFDSDHKSITILKDSNLSAVATNINNELTAAGRATMPTKEANIVGNTITAFWAALNAP